MMALLRVNGLWRLVSGQSKKPSLEGEKLELWLDHQDMAAGLLFLCVEPEQRVYLKGIEDDPVEIWAKLETVHMHKSPVTRFNAYDDLFRIRKGENESFQSLMNRVHEAMLKIQTLRPSGFTLAQCDEELAVMTLIHSLPDHYSSFSSALLLLPTLDKATVQVAFKNEENRLQHHSTHNSALHTVSTSSSSSPSPPNLSPSSPYLSCDFCNRNHALHDCIGFHKAKLKALQKRIYGYRSKCDGKDWKQKSGKTVSVEGAPNSDQDVSPTGEFATATRSFAPNSSHRSVPCQPRSHSNSPSLHTRTVKKTDSKSPSISSSTPASLSCDFCDRSHSLHHCIAFHKARLETLEKKVYRSQSRCPWSRRKENSGKSQLVGDVSASELNGLKTGEHTGTESAPDLDSPSQHTSPLPSAIPKKVFEHHSIVTPFQSPSPQPLLPASQVPKHPLALKRSSSHYYFINPFHSPVFCNFSQHLSHTGVAHQRPLTTFKQPNCNSCTCKLPQKRNRSFKPGMRNSVQWEDRPP